MNGDCVMEENPHASQSNGRERRLPAVERDVAVIGSNYATKEDLVKLESRVQDRLSRIENGMGTMENRLIRWYFGTSVGLVGVAFAFGKYL